MESRNRRFDGRVAIVTGAGRGIGRQDALLFARNGAKVVVNDLGSGPAGGGGDASVAQSVVDEISAAGGTAIAETSSVSTMAGAKAVVEAAMDSFGRIDFLINNAGFTRACRIDQMTERDFDDIIAVNLKGYFATIKYSAPHLIKRGGSIVNLSSASGFGHYSMSTYAAAKEGVVGLTRSVARDLGQFGIRCNAVRPMSGESAMTTKEVLDTVRYSNEALGLPVCGFIHLSSGVGCEALPQHAAAGTVWLCTEEASPLNGREIFVGGGQIALVQEPEFIRAQFNAHGWTLDSLCEPAIVAALTEGARNRFPLRSN